MEVGGAAEVQVWQVERWVVGEGGVLVPALVIQKLLPADFLKK